MDIRQRLAKNLRRLRTEKGWSQEEYADLAGIHRTYVSDIERGARNPTITVVEKLAAPFEVSAGKMIDLLTSSEIAHKLIRELDLIGVRYR